jgi:hypothetical protein
MSSSPEKTDLAVREVTRGEVVTLMRVVEPFSIERYELTRPLAKELSTSELIPKAYHGKVADIMLAMEKLRSLGLNPVVSLSGTYVVNGRVSIWGDTWLGVIQSAPGYGGMQETFDKDLDGGTAYTTFRRYIAGAWQVLTKSFSLEDAKKAKLAGKDTYASFPKDMLQWRARTRAGALFADILQGMKPAEVQNDIPDAEIVEQAPPPAVPMDKIEAAKQAEAPNRSSHVIGGVVLERESKPESKTKWQLFRVDCVDGEKFYTKEPDLADYARSFIGKAVLISFALAAQDTRAITKIEGVE